MILQPQQSGAGHRRTNHHGIRYRRGRGQGKRADVRYVPSLEAKKVATVLGRVVVEAEEIAVDGTPWLQQEEGKVVGWAPNSRAFARRCCARLQCLLA